MMEQFFTRTKANEGIKVPLFTPDGEATEHFLIVRSIYSDSFRDAEREAVRQIADVAAVEDKQEQKQQFKNLELGTIAALISGWSFEQDFTPENVKKFLTEAPQIADLVDQIAKKKHLFFKPSSKPSKSSPEKS